MNDFYLDYISYCNNDEKNSIEDLSTIVKNLNNFFPPDFINKSYRCKECFEFPNISFRGNNFIYLGCQCININYNININNITEYFENKDINININKIAENETVKIDLYILNTIKNILDQIRKRMIFINQINQNEISDKFSDSFDIQHFKIVDNKNGFCDKINMKKSQTNFENKNINNLSQNLIELDNLESKENENLFEEKYFYFFLIVIKEYLYYPLEIHYTNLKTIEIFLIELYCKNKLILNYNFDNDYTLIFGEDFVKKK